MFAYKIFKNMKIILICVLFIYDIYVLKYIFNIPVLMSIHFFKFYHWFHLAHFDLEGFWEFVQNLINILMNLFLLWNKNSVVYSLMQIHTQFLNFSSNFKYQFRNYFYLSGNDLYIFFLYYLISFSKQTFVNNINN